MFHASDDEDIFSLRMPNGFKWCQPSAGEIVVRNSFDT